MDHEHEYRSSRRMAKRLADHAADQVNTHPERAAVLAATAQVHATLAQSAATMATARHIEDDEGDE